MIEILLKILLFVSLFFLPFWFTLILGLFVLIFLKSYLVIFVFFLMDILFLPSDWGGALPQLPFTILAIILITASLFMNKYVRLPNVLKFGDSKNYV